MACLGGFYGEAICVAFITAMVFTMGEGYQTKKGLNNTNEYMPNAKRCILYACKVDSDCYWRNCGQEGRKAVCVTFPFEMGRCCDCHKIIKKRKIDTETKSIEDKSYAFMPSPFLCIPYACGCDSDCAWKYCHKSQKATCIRYPFENGVCCGCHPALPKARKKYHNTNKKTEQDHQYLNKL